MPFLDSLGRLVVGAVGALSAGCLGDDLVVAPIPSEGVIRHQHDGTDGWNLVGSMFGTERSDEGNDVVVGPDGTVHVGGYEGGLLGQTSVDPSGDARGVVRSYAYSAQHNSLDLQGSPVELGRDNGLSDVIEALTFAPGTGQLHYAGRTTGSFYQGAPHGGQYDLLTGWLTPGQAPTAFQYGSARPQHPRRIEVGANGDVVISGYDDIYIPTNFVEAWEDPFVVKLNREGEALVQVNGWPLQFNTVGSDVLMGLTTAASGGGPIYIAGTTLAGSGRGMFVRKYQPDGVMEWRMPQSAIGLDLASSLATLPDGNVLFAGATYGQLGDQAFGEQDAVVRLITPDQQISWTKQYGTELSEIVTDMAVDALGNIYIVGETLGSFDPLVPNQGEIDIFLLKLSPDGSDMKSFQLGSPGDDHPASVAVDDSGNVYVTGYTTSTLFEGKPNSGSRDGFVFRVTPPDFGTCETDGR